MKRVISAILSMMLFVSMPFCANAYEAFEEDSGAIMEDSSVQAQQDLISSEASDYTALALSDGTVRLTAYKGSGEYVNIPSYIDGKKVTSLHWTFSDNSRIKVVNIPNTITDIDNRAFKNCTSLTKISIPETITKIGREVFIGCTSLQEFSVPDSVTELGNGVFTNCTSLKYVKLPEKIKSIPDSAFYGCTSLVGVSIPNKISKIENAAFANCSSLSKVVITPGVTQIAENAFLIDNKTFPSGLTFYGFYHSTAESYAAKYKIKFVKITTTKDIDADILPGLMIGDINSDKKINAYDSLMILRTSVNLEYMPINVCDVDNDGKITSADSLLVLRYSVQINDNTKIGTLL